MQREDARGWIQEGQWACDVLCHVVPSPEMGGGAVCHCLLPVDPYAYEERPDVETEWGERAPVLGVEAKTAMWIGLSGGGSGA